ncbi:MAG: DUF1553 domain-containing protein [Verrucomicrobiales bacterium]|nr:DUF1553 domain-containing protein [Verrucomicrobiales bacterium]
MGTFRTSFLGIITAGLLSAADVDPEALRFFETEIRPVLADSCFECHGPEKAKGSLRLDHIDYIQKGGDSGPVIVSKKPGESLLIEAIQRTDPDFSMPPKADKALTGKQVAAFEKWIAMGAPWPKEVAKKGEVDEHGFTKEDRNWWAIQPVKKPAVPTVKTDANGWPKNEIDRFILRKLKEKGLKPAPKAGPRELLRRMTYDLHGLPPTPAAVEKFVADFEADEDAAVAAKIDELLASPRYGERWAQHWLDVVRYAESDGYRADFYRPDAWRFRDYVIASLNSDKPYDEFVREHLAADEFAADDPDRLIATAFLRHGIYEYNQRNARMHWELIMNEMTNVTGEAFLGLGIGCAQCHDHKFDPILQKDYYALQAFLSTVWWPEDRMLGTAEELADYREKMAEWDAETAEIRAGLDEMMQPLLDSKRKSSVKQFPADIQAMVEKKPEDRTAYEEQMAQLVERQVIDQQAKIDPKKHFEKDPEKKAKYEDLKKRLEELAEKKPKPLPTAFISTDISRDPAATILKTRTGKTEIEPGFLTLLGEPVPKIEPTESTPGRRTALAKWITSPENPLSTRVITNRIWQHHFGRGIVPTPNDFGTLGEKPSHPELLDWLTVNFLEGGWKMKRLHRLIMTSAAYRQTSRREPGQTESMTDPGNKWLWRFPPKRLSAEQIRDAMLAVSGELSSTGNGPSKSGAENVRSVFVKKMRNTPDNVLATFDAPNGFDSTPTRLQTTTPTQSLMLVNAEWPLERARAFAVRVLKGKTSPGTAEIEKAFELTYARKPDVSELASAQEFVNSLLGEGPVQPPEPVDKFPSETGLRPIDQHFTIAKEFGLGERALWLQPGSRFEQLELKKSPLDDDSFTIEAVVQLDSIHRDASVNTLVSRWNGNQQTGGWTFGVTSEKSRYQPRNFILQLIGKNVGGDVLYEVVASDLRVPTGVPVYLAAAISTDENGNGFAEFYLKDLSDPKSGLQTARVDHSICGGIQTSSLKTLIGGRDQKGHLWDGQLARLKISRGALPKSGLLISETEPAARSLLDWQFTGKDGEQPVPDTAWLRRPKPATTTHGIDPKWLAAMTDFCHALLNSNEFLYLH